MLIMLVGALHVELVELPVLRSALQVRLSQLLCRPRNRLLEQRARRVVINGDSA